MWKHSGKDKSTLSHTGKVASNLLLVKPNTTWGNFFITYAVWVSTSIQGSLIKEKGSIVWTPYIFKTSGKIRKQQRSPWSMHA